MIWVSLSTVNFVAAVEPNETPEAQLNPLPVIVTGVPPLSGPFIGLMLVTDGGG